MKRTITKILLGLLTSTTSIATYASDDIKWKSIFKEDFGGNSETDSVLCKVSPNDKDAEDGYFTQMTFSGLLNPSMSNYMLLKSTDGPVGMSGIKLTDCGDGYCCWATIGDHTFPNDTNKGYFMVFDCQSGSLTTEIPNVIIYKKAFPVSKVGEKFRVRAWMASLTKWGGNTVSLEIKDEDDNIIAQLDDDLSINSVEPGVWKSLELSFIVDDVKTKKLYLVVNAKNVNPSGFDFAIDDISIESEELGGVESLSSNGINVVKTEYYNFEGKLMNGSEKGLLIERQYLENGSVINRKISKE